MKTKILLNTFAFCGASVERAILQPSDINYKTLTIADALEQLQTNPSLIHRTDHRDLKPS
jgi:hypothetical protein